MTTPAHPSKPTNANAAAAASLAGLPGAAQLSKRARHDADHEGASALCGPDRTPVSIPHAAAVRMRMVADILQDSSEEGRLEIPLPHVEAPIMRAAVDFLLAGKPAGRSAPLLRGDCCAADVVPLLLAASFLQAPELEAVALASLALKASSAGAAVLAARAVPAIELFAGLGVGGANTGDSACVGGTGAYLASLQTLLDVRTVHYPMDNRDHSN